MIEFRSFPKSPREDNKHYRNLARDEDCMLRVPSVCCGDSATTVLAHSNASADGKGMGYKSHDHCGIFSCFTCHTWLDQGRASPEEKATRFKWALERQAVRLMQIVTDPSRSKRDREAAQWGLDGLGKPRLA